MASCSSSAARLNTPIASDPHLSTSRWQRRQPVGSALGHLPAQPYAANRSNGFVCGGGGPVHLARRRSASPRSGTARRSAIRYRTRFAVHAKPNNGPAVGVSLFGHVELNRPGIEQGMKSFRRSLAPLALRVPANISDVRGVAAENPHSHPINANGVAINNLDPAAFHCGELSLSRSSW
jgi:hypothetical protein